MSSLIEKKRSEPGLSRKWQKITSLSFSYRSATVYLNVFQLNENRIPSKTPKIWNPWLPLSGVKCHGSKMTIISTLKSSKRSALCSCQINTCQSTFGWRWPRRRFYEDGKKHNIQRSTRGSTSNTVTARRNCYHSNVSSVRSGNCAISKDAWTTWRRFANFDVLRASTVKAARCLLSDDQSAGQDSEYAASRSKLYIHKSTFGFVEPAAWIWNGTHGRTCSFWWTVSSLEPREPSSDTTVALFLSGRGGGGGRVSHNWDTLHIPWSQGCRSLCHLFKGSFQIRFFDLFSSGVWLTLREESRKQRAWCEESMKGARRWSRKWRTPERGEERKSVTGEAEQRETDVLLLGVLTRSAPGWCRGGGRRRFLGWLLVNCWVGLPSQTTSVGVEGGWRGPVEFQTGSCFQVVGTWFFFSKHAEWTLVPHSMRLHLWQSDAGPSGPQLQNLFHPDAAACDLTCKISAFVLFSLFFHVPDL